MPLPANGSLPATRAHSRVAASRRVAALVAAPLAAVAGVFAVQLTGSGPPPQAAQALTPEGGSADETACRTEYASLRRPDGFFTARLAITNVGGHDLRDWSVRFLVPQRQRVTAVTGARWLQESRTVTLEAADELPAGAEAAMTVRGTFDQRDGGVPGASSVAGVPCTQVAPGADESPGLAAG